MSNSTGYQPATFSNKSSVDLLVYASCSILMIFGGIFGIILLALYAKSGHMQPVVAAMGVICVLSAVGSLILGKNVKLYTSVRVSSDGISVEKFGAVKSLNWKDVDGVLKIRGRYGSTTGIVVTIKPAYANQGVQINGSMAFSLNELIEKISEGAEKFGGEPLQQDGPPL